MAFGIVPDPRMPEFLWSMCIFCWAVTWTSSSSHEVSLIQELHGSQMTLSLSLSFDLSPKRLAPGLLMRLEPDIISPLAKEPSRKGFVAGGGFLHSNCDLLRPSRKI